MNYPESSTGSAIDAINPPKPAAASGLLQGALEGQDEDGDDDDDSKDGTDLKSNGEVTNNKLAAFLCDGTTSKGQKKKRKGKKNKKATVTQQTSPPRVALADVFRNQPYPEGQIVDYIGRGENLRRTTDEELRHLSIMNNMDSEFLKDYRKAAEVHRQVRQYVQTIAKPGVTMAQLADEIENGVRALVDHQAVETGDALKSGMGFPTGLCLNNVAAHWTPNPGGKEVVLRHDDVLSIDFGVHVNGRIVDSAFTVAHNPVYDNLLEGVKAATNTGLKVGHCHLIFWLSR